MKIERSCPTCSTSERKGLLPLGKGEFLKCPDCGGTGTMVMFEQRITPPVRVFLSGQSWRELKMPRRSPGGKE